MRGHYLVPKKAAILMAVVIGALFFGTMGVNAAESYSDTGGDIGLLALGAGMIVCGIVLWIIWIILAIWAYKDAKKRGMSAPIVWFLVVFFLGIIGLIIYLIVRPKEVPQNTNGATATTTACINPKFLSHNLFFFLCVIQF